MNDIDAGRKKQAASRRIMERVAEAFGVMMLDTGLFQADAHPGNILVMKGAPMPATRSYCQPCLAV